MNTEKNSVTIDTFTVFLEAESSININLGRLIRNSKFGIYSPRVMPILVAGSDNVLTSSEITSKFEPMKFNPEYGDVIPTINIVNDAHVGDFKRPKINDFSAKHLKDNIQESLSKFWNLEDTFDFSGDIMLGRCSREFEKTTKKKSIKKIKSNKRKLANKSKVKNRTI